MQVRFLCYILVNRLMSCETLDTMQKNRTIISETWKWMLHVPHLRWVYNLTLNRIIVKNTLHLRINGFSGLMVQSYNITSVMLSLHAQKHDIAKLYLSFTPFNKMKLIISKKIKFKYTVRAMITSCVSRPEFSASVLGTTRRASAKAWTPSWARCYKICTEWLEW